MVFAQHGVRFVPKGMAVPPVLRVARALVAPIGWVSAPFRMGQPKAKRISAALTRLGPSYVKLGQFLATRADVIGPDLARDLAQDFETGVRSLVVEVDEEVIGEEGEGDPRFQGLFERR